MVRTIKLIAESLVMLGAVFLLLLSAVAYRNLRSAEEDSSGEDAAMTATEPEHKTEISDSFRLLDTESGRLLELSEEEFLLGNLACELSPDIPEESMKAQAVASLSFFTYKKEHPEAEEYDFSCNSSSGYVYMTEEQRQKQWGESFEANSDRFRAVIAAVQGERLSYHNAVACASYFAASSGNTESAAELWGEEIPYLSPVSSPYDAFSPGFEQSYSFSPNEVRAICGKTWPEGKFEFERDEASWFTEISYSAGGGVCSVNICGFSVTGQEFAEAFGLSSPTFTVEKNDSGFTIRSKGKGSAVGMSQYGAAYMAENGASYLEILRHYYPGTEISKA